MSQGQWTATRVPEAQVALNLAGASLRAIPPAVPRYFHCPSPQDRILKALARTPQAGHRVALSVPARDADLTLSLLQTYGTLALKPRQPDRCRGITRLSRRADGQLELGSGSGPVRMLDESGLEETLDAQQLMLQPWLESRTSWDAAFDLRVHLIRAGQQWQIGETIARVGPAGGLTHRFADGSCSYCEPASFLAAERAEAVGLLEQLETLAVTLAQRYTALGATTSELGLDFLIDAAGQPTLIEADWRPERSHRGLQVDSLAADRLLALAQGRR